MNGPRSLRYSTSIVVVALLIIAASPALAQPTTSGATGALPLGTNPGALVDLFVPDSVERPFAVEVPIDGRLYHLDLHKHSVRSSLFEVRVQLPGGAYATIDPGPIRTFRGEVRELKDSQVAGTLTEEGFEAVVFLADRTHYGIQPARGPVRPGTVGAHRVFRGDPSLSTDPPQDAPSTHVIVDDEPPPPPSTQSIVANRCGSLCVAEVAFDGDVEFFVRRGSSVSNCQTRIESLLNVANVPYERDLQVTNVITTILVRTAEPDPYSASTSPTVLPQEMQVEWDVNQGHIVRDLAVLMTGKNLPSRGGARYLGLNLRILCSDFVAFAVSDTEFEATLNCAADNLAASIALLWTGRPYCSCSSPADTMNTTNLCALRFGDAAFLNYFAFARSNNACLEALADGDVRGLPKPICPGTYSGSTARATNDGSSSCGNSSTSPDVWFVYVPESGGTLTIDTCGSSFDSVLSIHTIVPDAEIACNDESCGSQSSLTVAVTAGTSYRIRLAGANGASGAYSLHVVGPTCRRPLNDDSANATVLCTGFQDFFVPSRIPADFEGTTINATPDGSSTCDASASPDVWFQYTPGADDCGVFAGDMDVSVCETNFDTVVSVHSGIPGTTANQIACDDNGCGGNGSHVRVTNLTTCTTYWIRVAGKSAADVGTFRLRLVAPECVQNACTEDLAIPTIGPGRHLAQFSGTTRGRGPWGIVASSCDPSDALPDLWFRIRTNSRTILRIDTCGTNDFYGVDTGVDTILTLHDESNGFCGDSDGNTSEVACNDDWPTSADPNACAPGDLGAAGDSFISHETNGGDYFLQVMQNCPQTRGPVILNINSFPINERCTRVLQLGLGTTFGSLENATRDGSSSCDASGPAPDIWYSFGGNLCVGGTLVITTCGTQDLSGVDTILTLYTGGCPGSGGTEAACNDNWTDSPASTVCLGQDAGAPGDSVVLFPNPLTTGRLRVSRTAASPDGVVKLNLSCNRRPNQPSRPSGATQGYEGVSYAFTTLTTDPDGGNLRYTFDWGDGSQSTTNPVPSGTVMGHSHSYANDGSYSVTVVAIDEVGNVSVPSVARVIDIADIPCRAGNVNVDSGGSPADVLTVNGSAGTGPERLLIVDNDSPIDVSLVPAPAGPPGSATGPGYAVWVWLNAPNSSTDLDLPFGIGRMCMSPQFVNCGSRCTSYAAKTIRSYCGAVRCSTAEATGAIPPGVVLRIPSGRLPAFSSAWVQGVLRDNSDTSGRRISVTNGVELFLSD